MFKQCPRCGLKKLLSDFNKDVRKPFGVRCECRSCQSAQTLIDSENRRNRRQKINQDKTASMNQLPAIRPMTIKSINGVDVLNTSELGGLIGIPLSAKQIQECGIKPYAETATAILWRRKDAAAVAIAIADSLLVISDRINEEYKQ